PGALASRSAGDHGSNNWVISGSRTPSGFPLVANDPHLAFGAPGFWYLARLKTPQHEIAGATVAGTPFVVIGHNEHIAWGFTTTTADIEDLFIEKIDPADPSRYLTPTGTAPFATRKEIIQVRGAPPVVLTVRSTRHGPVLSDALPPGTADPGYVLALQTTFLGSDDESADALWGIDRAGTWAEFRSALGNFLGPPQNAVFGDTNGTIGFIVPGHIPIRRNGDGWMPVPGWTGEYDWTGTIPYVELPEASNPRSGYFASANNKIVPDRYRFFISRDWDVPYRIERIEALLKEAPKQTPESSAAMEADTLSLMARQLVPLMTRIAPRTADAGAALQLLRHWDFRMAAGRPEPLIFIAWLREFAHSVFFDRLGPAAAGYWRLRPLVIENILTDHQYWCASKRRPEETCETRLADALEAALAELRRDYGTDMANWRWGEAHIAEFPNRILDRIPLVRDWFNVAIAKAGGPHTVDVGALSVRDDKAPFAQRFGAGLRIITDLAHPDRSRMIVAPGQSGNPLSPHYADLLTRWRSFDGLAPGRAPAVATLTLEPAR
ncbi:MAG: penicillin acylase family protein, partial [Stellaceae bacterium]